MSVSGIGHNYYQNNVATNKHNKSRVGQFSPAFFSACFLAIFSFSSRFFLAFNRRSSSSLYFFCILSHPTDNHFQILL